MSEQKLPDQQTNLSIPQESAPTEPLSFHERKRQQLGQERETRVIPDDPTPNLSQVELPEQEPVQPAHQPERLDQVPEPSPEVPTEPALEPGVDYSETPTVGEPAQDASVDWETRFNEAEGLRSNMQSDYQRKTQRLAENRRELKEGLEQNKHVAESYLTAANQNLQKFNGIDWQHLQSTLDPVEYNKRVGAYQQAVTQRDRMVKFHENIVTAQTQRVETAREQEAEVSRDILSATVPNWGNELYGSLRTYAIDKLAYTPDDFNDITDHRTIQLIHHHWSTSNAGKTVQNLTKTETQQPPRGGNLPPSRGADGKFRTVRESWLENPGERGRAADYFQEKLRREREGR